MNCFADTLSEIFKDLAAVVAQCPVVPSSPAYREIANAELKAKQLGLETPGRSTTPVPESRAPRPQAPSPSAPAAQRPPAPPPAPGSPAPQPPARPTGQPVPKSPPSGDEPPFCPECGSNQDMELIKFQDRKTGKPRQAWKCQTCNKWHWPDNTPATKGRAR